MPEFGAMRGIDPQALQQSNYHHMYPEVEFAENNSVLWAFNTVLNVILGERQNDNYVKANVLQLVSNILELEIYVDREAPSTSDDTRKGRSIRTAQYMSKVNHIIITTIITNIIVIINNFDFSNLSFQVSASKYGLSSSSESESSVDEDLDYDEKKDDNNDGSDESFEDDGDDDVDMVAY